MSDLGCSRIDALIKEYLSFRGFLASLKSFDLDKKHDKSRNSGFQSVRVVELLLQYLRNFEFEKFRLFWEYLDRTFFSKVDFAKRGGSQRTIVGSGAGGKMTRQVLMGRTLRGAAGSGSRHFHDDGAPSGSSPSDDGSKSVPTPKAAASERPSLATAGASSRTPEDRPDASSSATSTGHISPPSASAASGASATPSTLDDASSSEYGGSSSAGPSGSGTGDAQFYPGEDEIGLMGMESDPSGMFGASSAFGRGSAAGASSSSGHGPSVGPSLVQGGISSFIVGSAKAATAQLFTALKKFYVVNCVLKNRLDKVIEFFSTYGEELLHDHSDTGEHLIMNRMSPHGDDPPVRHGHGHHHRDRSSAGLHPSHGHGHDSFDSERVSSTWSDWFVLPFLKRPAQHPPLAPYFNDQWFEMLSVSLHNFVSTAFQSIPRPRLITLERTVRERNMVLRDRLEKAIAINEHLRVRVGVVEGYVRRLEKLHNWPHKDFEKDVKAAIRRRRSRSRSKLGARRKHRTMGESGFAVLDASGSGSGASSSTVDVPAGSPKSRSTISAISPLRPTTRTAAIRIPGGAKRLPTSSASADDAVEVPRTEAKPVEDETPQTPASSTTTPDSPHQSKGLGGTPSASASGTTPASPSPSSSGLRCSSVYIKSVFSGHTELVSSCVFSPDGSMLATGSLDESLRVWNTRNVHDEPASASSASSDASSGSRHSRRHLHHRPKSPAPPGSLVLPVGSGVLSLDWVDEQNVRRQHRTARRGRGGDAASEEAPILVVLGATDGLLRILDVRKKKCVAEQFVDKRSPYLLNVSCAPGQRSCVVSCLGVRSESLSGPAGQSAAALASVKGILRNAPRLSTAATAAAKRKGSLYRYMISPSGTLDFDVRFPIDTLVESLAFNDVGQLFAAGCADGFIRVFDADAHFEIMSWKAHDGRVSSMYFDGSCMVSIGSDGVVKEWDTYIKGMAKTTSSIPKKVRVDNLPRIAPCRKKGNASFVLGSPGYVFQKFGKDFLPTHRLLNPHSRNVSMQHVQMSSVDWSGDGDMIAGGDKDVCLFHASFEEFDDLD